MLDAKTLNKDIGYALSSLMSSLIESTQDKTNKKKKKRLDPVDQLPGVKHERR